MGSGNCYPHLQNYVACLADKELTSPLLARGDFSRAAGRALLPTCHPATSSSKRPGKLGIAHLFYHMENWVDSSILNITKGSLCCSQGNWQALTESEVCLNVNLIHLRFGYRVPLYWTSGAVKANAFSQSQGKDCCRVRAAQKQLFPPTPCLDSLKWNSSVPETLGGYLAFLSHAKHFFKKECLIYSSLHSFNKHYLSPYCIPVTVYKTIAYTEENQ